MKKNIQMSIWKWGSNGQKKGKKREKIKIARKDKKSKIDNKERERKTKRNLRI